MIKLFNKPVNISKEYESYVKLAQKLADEEFPNVQLAKIDAKENAYQRHLLNMIEMFCALQDAMKENK